MTTPRYTGRVATVHHGYAFILRTSVLLNGLTCTDLGDHDIYLNQFACPAPLRPGMLLEFSVEVDSRRGAGHFRAVAAEEICEGEVLLPGGAHELVPGLVLTGTGLIPTQGKQVSDDALRQVRANQPFRGLKRQRGPVAPVAVDESQVISTLTAYLRHLFPSLTIYDLSFSVVGTDKAAENRVIEENAEDYVGMSMTAQAQQLRDTYSSYRATVELLTWLYENHYFRAGAPINPEIIASLIKIAQDAKLPEQKVAITTQFGVATELMSTCGILGPNTVLPMCYLAEMFLALPVWFFPWSLSDITEARASSDPAVLSTTRFFCDLMPGNQRWADLYQIYNRRGRTLEHYVGEEIPPSIRRVIREAVDVFDYVVVMTPYHDVAGSDWEDETWLRTIDPYVVGFMAGIPYMFILGRYVEGAGDFPEHSRQVADTMDYLRTNKGRLRNFNRSTEGGKLATWANWVGRTDNQLGSELITQVDELLAAFQEGIVFDWLRNERPDTTFTTTT
jgi:hypothetical protein